MKNGITSVNAWLGERLPDVDVHFDGGEQVQFPSVVVSIGEAREPGPRRCAQSPLVELAVECTCIADGKDAASARGLAMRILDVVTGDSDRAERIPYSEWDFGATPPAPIRTVGMMDVTGISYIEDFDPKLPDLRRSRVRFTVRTRI